MKKLIVGVIAGLIAGAGVSLVVRTDHEGGTAPKAEAAAEKPRENPLKLTAARRDAAGLVLARPQVQEIAPAVTAYGRVLDPAPFVAMAAEVAGARATLRTSEKALARAKDLFAAEANVSAQVVEAAEAARARDEAAALAAESKLVSTWGRDLLARTGPAAGAAEWGQRAILLRIEVPWAEPLAADLKSVRVLWSGADTRFEAEVIGPAPAVDPQVQGRALLAIARTAAVPVGAQLEVTLPGAGTAASVVVVPRSAVVYHQGSAWVFVLEEEDTFERKLVTLGRSVGAEGVVVSGLADPSQQVVVTGAGQLLSAELQAGGAPEEK